MSGEVVATTASDRLFLPGADGPSTTVAALLRVPSQVRLRDLDAAMAVVAARHPMVGARLTADERSWVLPEHAGDGAPRPTILDEADGGTTLAQVMAHLADGPFALRREPPIRVHLLGRARSRHVVLIGHHAALDGIGLRTVALDLARAVTRRASGAGPPDRAWASLRDVGGVCSPPDEDDGDHPVVARLRGLRTPRPVRVSRHGAHDVEGTGAAVRVFPPDLVGRLRSRRASSPTAVLVAAVAGAISLWNEEHGDPAGPLTIGVPVNVRPPRTWLEGVGNAALPWPVRLEAGPGPEVLSSVRRQLADVRLGVRSPHVRALAHHLAARPRVPLWALHLLAGASTFVSVLPAGTEHGDPALVGTGPVPATVGVTFTAVVGPRRLALCARHRRSHLSPVAALRLLRSVESHLDHLVASER